MAERRRGLGRGLGALIPDVVTDERPVDVFFPAADKPQRDDVSRETRDPAESMRTARSRSKAAATKKTPAAKAGDPATSSTKKAAQTTKKSSVPKTTATQKAQSSRAGSTAATSAKKGSSSRPQPQESTSDRKAQDQGAVENVSRETSDLLSVPGTVFGEIPVAAISPNPKQPRTVFDEDQLNELVASIKEIGVLQPIVVRIKDAAKPSYELIMGERRLRASKLAGKETIPAIIREVQDDDLLRDALLENLHRADLNPLEEAAAYQQLLDDFSCTQEELSARIGRSRPQISNTLRLLKLPSLVQRRVAAQVISSGHARAILGLNDSAQMEELAQRIVAEGLSVRATEEAVVLMNRGDQHHVSRETREPDPALLELAQKLGDRLDTRVNISMGKRKGKLSVEFANAEDLDRIIKALGMA